MTGRPTALPRAIGEDVLSCSSGTVGAPLAGATSSELLAQQLHGSHFPYYRLIAVQVWVAAHATTAAKKLRAAFPSATGFCTRRSVRVRRARTASSRTQSASSSRFVVLSSNRIQRPAVKFSPFSSGTLAGSGLDFRQLCGLYYNKHHSAVSVNILLYHLTCLRVTCGCVHKPGLPLALVLAGTAAIPTNASVFICMIDVTS